MNGYKILMLREHPELKSEMAAWFHSKWGIPLQAYVDSMNECLENALSVPQWYCVYDGGRIIGGLGVIENDFHNRPDLSPNVCAVYVEEEYRCHGIAGEMLNFVCRDMHALGIGTLYLLTDHDSFYERYDWQFLCPVQGDGEEHMARMYIKKAEI